VFVHRLEGPLVAGRLIRRYKRFFVDVELEEDGRVVTAHTPNTGSMLGCSTPGSRVYLSLARRASRRLPYTLEMVRAGRIYVGVNTLVPNRLVHAAVVAGAIPELVGYAKAQREVRVSDESRVDLELTGGERSRRCYVEIKSVTLVEDGVALFPDARTDRGRRHLEELVRLVRAGHRGVIFFLVQRADGEQLRPAEAIDPRYADALRVAVRRGVEALAYRARARRDGIRLERRIPVVVSS
jgi:sugar fermentation stimulation protein A